MIFIIYMYEYIYDICNEYMIRIFYFKMKIFKNLIFINKCIICKLIIYLCK